MKVLRDWQGQQSAESSCNDGFNRTTRQVHDRRDETRRTAPLSKDIRNRCRLRHPLETPDRANDTSQVRRQLAMIVVIYFSKKRRNYDGTRAEHRNINGKRPVYFITNYARLTKTRGKERNKKPIDKMNDSITDSVQ